MAMAISAHLKMSDLSALWYRGIVEAINEEDEKIMLTMLAGDDVDSNDKNEDVIWREERNSKPA